MTERLLQFIWQFQLYNTSDLTTQEGESLQILFQGNLNSNQGPDFYAAKILLGKTIWAGSIELHVNTSAWNNHKHSKDANYNNVILHVVWHHDMDLQLPFSTLVLEERVAKLMLQKYDRMMDTEGFIPCEKNIHRVNGLTWQSWKERLLVERLQNKTELILALFKETNHHWDETLWWLVAKNFGIKVNHHAFELVARSLPINLLRRYKHQLLTIEAFLFGQAGMLEKSFTTAYPANLKKEYEFLKKKYKLNSIHEPIHFLLMRPTNFPTIRLAQLAMLIHLSEHLFAKIRAAKNLPDLKKHFDVTASHYWLNHFVFEKETKLSTKKIGTQMINNILINTVIPVIFAYGHYHHEAIYKERALLWLEQIKAEKNSITEGFLKLTVINKSAFDSQALLQLKTAYCEEKKCLECRIGYKLMKDNYE